MTQEQALDILKTGVNVFLTGEPGSGKSHTINRYVAYLRERGIEPAVTASTGIAATHIHGMTLHSWSGIGIARELSDQDIADIAKSRYIASRIRKTSVLILDEVSMIDGEVLSNAERVCRRVKKSSQPFGGMQVVLVGDFFQLPPVRKGSVSASMRQNEENLLGSGKIDSGFAFDSPAWRAIAPTVCYLTEQHRQEDKKFLEVLGAMRRNEFSETHFERLRGNMIGMHEIPSETTRLFSHNVDVDSMNVRELLKLSGKTQSFLMADRGPERLVETLKRGCLSPERLDLKVGATVMFTKNNPNMGYVNGTLGVVIGFDDETKCPAVMTRDENVIVVRPAEWAVEEEGEAIAKIIQIPLRLAWAITIHKSQGMSMDAAVMDLSQVFEFGQGYVALSRVRKLSGVYLLGANDRAFRVHPEIAVKDVEFREASKKAERLDEALPQKEKLQLQKDFVRLCGGSWLEYGDNGELRFGLKIDGIDTFKPKKRSESNLRERVAEPYKEIRQTHKQAYAKWTEEEETRLKRLFDEGLAIKDIAITMGRKEGGIRSRLRKLGIVI